MAKRHLCNNLFVERLWIVFIHYNYCCFYLLVILYFLSTYYDVFVCVYAYDILYVYRGLLIAMVTRGAKAWVSLFN